MLSRARLPFRALLKNALLLVFLQPIGKNALCIASFGVLAAVAWYAPGSLPMIVLIACSLAALLACHGVNEQIEKRIVSHQSLL